ncbi:hypothetical protein CPAR01_10634 [Colletotrichum paranaense]|uniref:Uncharacterized protein n=1 Tax=Colletotrichum paranaense TaxID=1914294 RepID=A0ABQ9SET9_9PEZI|nr:uncharacterized protein CPAR01_10634 [Colletotrichum paranaense]KAK1533926.1 hypothetical protein CPAR01_10634 [Colletotrichum paranaense]
MERKKTPRLRDGAGGAILGTVGARDLAPAPSWRSREHPWMRKYTDSHRGPNLRPFCRHGPELHSGFALAIGEPARNLSDDSWSPRRGGKAGYTPILDGGARGPMDKSQYSRLSPAICLASMRAKSCGIEQASAARYTIVGKAKLASPCREVAAAKSQTVIVYPSTANGNRATSRYRLKSVSRERKRSE